jgi:Methane oxygenase PmoA
MRQAFFLAANLSVVLLMVVAIAADEPRLPLKLKVVASERERTDATVAFLLLPGLAGQENLRLVETTGGRERPVAAQRDPAEGRLWWLASGKTAAGATRTYRLEAGAPVAAAGGVKILDSERTVEALAGGKPLLRYNKAHVEPPEGVNVKYGRSAHLHPVWTPGGAIVTDELPPDHLHQSGIFLSYTKTQFEDREVDFWNLAGGKGRVRFKALTSATSGPVFGQVQTEHEHVDLTAGDQRSEVGESAVGRTSGGKVALNETWKLRVWTAGLQSGFWIMDIDSTQKCATQSPLLLPEYHYGGMAIRAAREWTPEQVTFLTSEGDERKKGNHTRPKWCDIRGQVDGKAAGIALMTHPTNFRFPEPLRIHPTMPYMVYTPSFLGDWEIRPCTPHRARYRFVIHDGQLSPDSLDRIWRNWAEPLVAVSD